MALLGAHTKALPMPKTTIGGTVHQIEVSGVITRVSHSRPVNRQANPKEVRMRGCTRSVSRPTSRASTIVISAIGTSSSAARVGLRPRTTWAQIMIGMDSEVIEKPMTVIATLASE